MEYLYLLFCISFMTAVITACLGFGIDGIFAPIIHNQTLIERSIFIFMALCILFLTTIISIHIVSIYSTIERSLYYLV